MATIQLVGVEEYLHSTFEPDAEYVEGAIVFRPMPQKAHSKMQGYLIRSLFEVANPYGYHVWPEQRIRTRARPSHYRVPDVCVTLGEPDEEIFTEPPLLCVEILSPDDLALEVRTKVEEYLNMGVAFVWVIDPISFAGEVYTLERIERVRDSKFRAGEFEIDIRLS